MHKYRYWPALPGVGRIAAALPVLLAVLLLTSLVLTGCGLEVRRSEPTLRVGVLVVDAGRLEKVRGLREGLAQMGYTEGEGLEIQVLSAGGDRQRLPQVAQELVAQQPDILVAGGGIEAVMLKQATRESGLPVVMAGVAAPVETGLVSDTRHPGGNLTGVDNAHSELAGKRLEMFAKLVPGLRRVLVLVDPGVVPGTAALAVVQEAAAHLGIELEALHVLRVEDLAPALAAIPQGRHDGILVLPSHVLEEGAPVIGQASRRLGIPAMGLYQQDLEAGFLAIYGSSFYQQGYQAARLVVKVLAGEPPGEIPLESPDVPELVVNPAVARELGLSLGPVGLAFARLEEVATP